MLLSENSKERVNNVHIRKFTPNLKWLQKCWWISYQKSPPVEKPHTVYSMSITWASHIGDKNSRWQIDSVINRQSVVETGWKTNWRAFNNLSFADVLCWDTPANRLPYHHFCYDDIWFVDIASERTIRFKMKSSQIYCSSVLLVKHTKMGFLHF